MKSLYKAERPHRFSDVIGQEAELISMRALVKKRAFGHAELLTGPAGTGKTTIARILAMAANCTDLQGDEPCCQCKSCKSILEGSSPDVRELDAASNNGVEDIRQIIDEASYASPGQRKVFILDECHMLSKAASNALLKTLEEPPENVIFLLCTTEEDKVLDTIKSRCRIHRLKSIRSDAIGERIKAVCEKYGKKISPDAAMMIATHSNGAMRNALSILETFFGSDEITADMVKERLGITGEDGIFDVLDGVTEKKGQKALKSVQTLLESGKTPFAVVRSLLGAINDTETVKLGASLEGIANTAEYKERLKGLSEKADVADLDSLAIELKGVLKEADSTNADMYLELALRTAIGRQDKVASLSGEVERLTQRVIDLEKGTPVAPAAKPEAVSVEVAKADETTEAVSEAQSVDEDAPAEISEDDLAYAEFFNEGGDTYADIEAYRQSIWEDDCKEQQNEPSEAVRDEEMCVSVPEEETLETPEVTEAPETSDASNDVPFEDIDLSDVSFEEPEPVSATNSDSLPEIDNIVSFPEKAVEISEQKQEPVEQKAEQKTEPIKPEKQSEKKNAVKKLHGIEISSMSAADFFAKSTTTEEKEPEEKKTENSDEDDMPPLGFSDMFGDSEVAGLVWRALGNTEARDDLAKAAET